MEWIRGNGPHRTSKDERSHCQRSLPLASVSHVLKATRCNIPPPPKNEGELDHNEYNMFQIIHSTCIKRIEIIVSASRVLMKSSKGNISEGVIAAYLMGISIWAPPLDVKERVQHFKSEDVSSSAVVMHMGDGPPDQADRLHPKIKVSAHQHWELSEVDDCCQLVQDAIIRDLSGRSSVGSPSSGKFPSSFTTPTSV
jgi:hypothetical protein